MSHKIDLGLGKIITSKQKRDAIHIAIIPATAAHQLNPGDHVGINSHRRASARLKEKVGVVDPFLTKIVDRGQQFWLFVYPNTITGMNHQWEHPAFPEDELDSLYDLTDSHIGASASEEYIENFARECKLSYDELMDAASSYQEYGNYLSEGSRFEGQYVPQEFWKHYAEVTGRNVQDTGNFFSCSC